MVIFMQRYFVANQHCTTNQATITGPDVHHIRRVIRFKPGQELIVCNQEGVCHLSTIQSISEEAVIATFKERLDNTELPIQIDIAQGIIRKERFEFMIQKSMELGASTIIPIETKRTIVRPNVQKVERKLERWNVIAKEACEQAHRSKSGSVQTPRTLSTLPYHEYDKVIVAYEDVAGQPDLYEVLQTRYHKILIIIGPEGGLDRSEIQYLKTFNNVSIIGLGQRILRSETASSYILSVLGYTYEMVM